MTKSNLCFFSIKKKMAFGFSGVVFLVLSSCSLTRSPQSTPETHVEKVGCSSYEYYLIKELNHWLVSQDDLGLKENVVSVQSFNEDWLPSLEKNPRYQQLDEKQKQKLQVLIKDYLNYLLSVAPADKTERKQFLVSLALGDESDERRQAIQQQLQVYEKQMQEVLPADQSQQCGQSSEGSGPLDPVRSEEAQLRLEKSMRRLLATTYQSCQVLDLKPVHDYDSLVQGIKRQGSGSVRVITNVDLVAKTHYYIKNQSYGQGCFQVSKNPLIYDFGGRPAYTSDRNSKLNFFKNNGGSKVLGFDCSAMVYSVLLNAGLKMSSSIPFLAEDVEGAYSGHFLRPGTKQDCIDPVQVGPESTIRAGDIVAMEGHVLMIYKTGSDPLGIQNLTMRSQCSNIDLQKFDFQILQSSASKGGLGVNVYEGADYVNGVSSLRRGFLALAQRACYAKFDNKKYKIDVTGFSIVRHRKTPSCQSSPIEFEKSSCVESCIN